MLRKFVSSSRVIRIPRLYCPATLLQLKRPDLSTAGTGDTFTPVDPGTFGRRLEAAGFAEVAVERGRARFRFRASRK